MQDPKDLDGQPLELLIKLMRMTGAEDNIALVAVRKANAQLLKMGTDWEALLRGKVKIIADPFAAINIPEDALNPNKNQGFNPSGPFARRSAGAPPPPPPRHQPAPDAYPTQSRSRPQPQPKPQPTTKPKPGSPAFSGDSLERTIVNKFEGTCPKCQNKVLAGDGLAMQYKRPDGTQYWITEHEIGKCPAMKRSRPANTSADFQF